MSEIDLNLGDIETKICRLLYEQVNGETFSTTLVYDVVNEIYEEVFNQPNKQSKIRKSDHNFTVIPDLELNGQIVAGGTSIVLVNSSTLPSSGVILIDQELIAYTANNMTTTLTCSSSAIRVTHDDGAKVRPTYVAPSDIEKIQGLNVDGLPYNIMPYEEFIAQDGAHAREYAMYWNYLILPENNSTVEALLTYTPSFERLDSSTDIPSYIPNKWRVALLVNGAVGKLKMIDGQSDYERFYRPAENQNDKGGGLFYTNLRKFYAVHGRYTDLASKRTSKSIYD